MAKTRTSKFIIAAMTPAEREAHFKAVAKRSNDNYKPIANAKRRAKYAADPQGYIARQKERSARNPEGRRRVVRRSRARKPWLKALNASLARTAKDGGLNTLTKEWAQTTYTGKCVLTGFPFTVGNGDVVRKNGAHPYAPSIDKIDPTKGYTPDNCRFVLWVVNKFKDRMTDDEMFVVAGALVARRMAGLPIS